MWFLIIFSMHLQTKLVKLIWMVITGYFVFQFFCRLLIFLHPSNHQEYKMFLMKFQIFYSKKSSNTFFWNCFSTIIYWWFHASVMTVACPQLWLHQMNCFVASLGSNFHGYRSYRSVTIIRIISKVGTYVRVCWLMMAHWKSRSMYLLLSFEIILWKSGRKCILLYTI